VLAAAVAFAGWQGWRWYQVSQSTQASVLYETLAKAAQSGDAKALRDAGGTLTESHPRTLYASMGALVAARFYFDRNDLKNAKEILSGVGGCCGQMDIQVHGADLLVAENTKHQFARYDREGKRLGGWGGRARRSPSITAGAMPAGPRIGACGRCCGSARWCPIRRPRTTGSMNERSAGWTSRPGTNCRSRPSSGCGGSPLTARPWMPRRISGRSRRPWPRLIGWVRKMIPPAQRHELLPLGAQVSLLLGRYVRGQVVLVLIMWTATTIGLTAFGVPFSLLLGIMTGVLEVIPIGGLGEIGKNCTIVRVGRDCLVIDAGLMFPDEEDLGIDFVIPDYRAFEQAGTIHGVVLTHGHEDHVGRLP